MKIKKVMTSLAVASVTASMLIPGMTTLASETKASYADLETIKELAEQLKDLAENSGVNELAEDFVDDVLDNDIDDLDDNDILTDTIKADDNWKDDLEFVLDGQLFDMPGDLEDLKKAGWEFEDGAYDVGAGTTIIGSVKLLHKDYMSDDKFHQFCIEAGRVTNDDNETKDISECEAVSLLFTGKTSASDAGNIELRPDVRIVGDITFGTSKDEILDILGEPSYKYESDDSDYAVWSYWSDEEEYKSDTKIQLTFVDDTGVSAIELSKELDD